MRLYDEIIEETLKSMDGKEQRVLSVCGTKWPDEGKSMMILSSDTAYELGGGGLDAIGNTLVTTDKSLVGNDEVILIGKDLNEISSDSAYARIALVRVNEDSIGTGDKLYNTIRNIGYFRYHIYPRGFMLRVSSSSDRESVRVARKALEEGLNFQAVGNVMLKAIHLHKAVEAVKIIFVTDPYFDYAGLKSGLRKTKEITQAIDHMLKDVNMDCGSCGLQKVCDEVEELREMHFGISEKHI